MNDSAPNPIPEILEVEESHPELWDSLKDALGGGKELLKLFAQADPLITGITFFSMGTALHEKEGDMGHRIQDLGFGLILMRGTDQPGSIIGDIVNSIGDVGGLFYITRAVTGIGYSYGKGDELEGKQDWLICSYHIYIGEHAFDFQLRSAVRLQASKMPYISYAREANLLPITISEAMTDWFYEGSIYAVKTDAELPASWTKPETSLVQQLGIQDPKPLYVLIYGKRSSKYPKI